MGKAHNVRHPAVSPELMITRLTGLCEYLIVKGLVIKDGETVGTSEDERIRVRYTTSRMQPGTPILDLKLEQG
jgi:hypothetical protein